MISYTLAADFTGTSDIVNDAGHKIGERPIYLGGEVAVGDGTFNIGAALDAGGGTFAVDDANQALTAVLDVIDALKRTPHGADHFVVGAYTTQPKLALQQLADARGLTKSGTKAELAEALEAYDLRAAGKAPAAERDAVTAARLPDLTDRGDHALEQEHDRQAAAEDAAAELAEGQADRRSVAELDEAQRREAHEATIAELDDKALDEFVEQLDEHDTSLLADVARAELERRTAAANADHQGV